jgi:hypothetical protein
LTRAQYIGATRDFFLETTFLATAQRAQQHPDSTQAWQARAVQKILWPVSLPSARFWFALPFHHPPVLFQLPLPSDGLGTTDPLLSHVNGTALQSLTRQATSIKTMREYTAKCAHENCRIVKVCLDEYAILLKPQLSPKTGNAACRPSGAAVPGGQLPLTE